MTPTLAEVMALADGYANFADGGRAALESSVKSLLDALESTNARCIHARNRLNDALHGAGAVIDDLEHAVAAVCKRLETQQTQQNK